VAREGLDLATSGRDPSEDGGRVGRVVRRYDGLRRAHRRGRRVGFDPSSLGSRLILQDPPRRGSGGFGSRDIRSRSERRRGSSGSGCAAVCRPARTEHVGEGRVPTRLRSDLALFCRIPLAVAREGLDLATSGRDPSGFGGRVGRVVQPCVALRRAHRRGRRAGFDPSSLGSRLILEDPPRCGSGGPGSRDIRSRSKRFRGPSGSGCAAV